MCIVRLFSDVMVGLLIDVDTGSDMLVSDCSSLVLSVFLFMLYMSRLTPTCVSLEHAHTSFVAELWLDSYSFAGPVTATDIAATSSLHPQGSTYPPGPYLY